MYYIIMMSLHVFWMLICYVYIVAQQLSCTEFIVEEGSVSARTKQRWRWAIEQLILLIRLDKENQSVISNL